MPQPPSSQQPSKNHHSSARPSPTRPAVPTWSCSVVPKVSWSDTGMHTQPRGSALLPRYLLLYHAQELPWEHCRVAPPVQTPVIPPENTLPWDRPCCGSGDPEENEGKIGPHSPLGCSYTGNRHAYSPGPAPLLPLLPTTITILSQLPAHTHSGQRPPHQPPEFRQQPWCRGELCPLHPPLPLATVGIQPGRSQRGKTSSPTTPTPLPNLQGGNTDTLGWA